MTCLGSQKFAGWDVLGAALSHPSFHPGCVFQAPSLCSVSQGCDEVLQGANLAENQLLFNTFLLR